jgi:hypothetical protein
MEAKTLEMEDYEEMPFQPSKEERKGLCIEEH